MGKDYLGLTNICWWCGASDAKNKAYLEEGIRYAVVKPQKTAITDKVVYVCNNCK